MKFSIRMILFLFLLLLIGLFIAVITYEVRTNRIEAWYFNKEAMKCKYNIKYNENNTIRFPNKGPFNKRRGYTLIPAFLAKLKQEGFYVESQAQWSSEMASWVDNGFYPVYDEKKRAGLCVFDRYGRTIFNEQFPYDAYGSFDSIPPVMVKTLLFIEDRFLLDSLKIMRNPAVDWPRFLNALFQNAGERVGIFKDAPGASTLATQIEKYRYSPGGVTSSARDKYRQMVSASLRAYKKGENTIEARKAITCEYINNLPLAAFPGFGEVIGLGEGLLVWYGTPRDSVDALLNKVESSSEISGNFTVEEWKQAGKYYRMVLSLFIAQRRPNLYLMGGPELLEEKTDQYIRTLCKEAVISEQLCNAALSSKIPLKKTPVYNNGNASFQLRKSANIIRTPMLRLLGLPSLYDLDRFDLTVKSVFDGKSQAAVSQFFNSLQDPAVIQSFGLNGRYMLPKGSLQDVIYSMTLYESIGGSNQMRLQVDSYNNYLNINEGTKLDLGSTAKLRTLVTYLEIVEKLHDRFIALTPEELAALRIGPDDHISQWARDYMLSKKSASLPEMLDAALNRTYSANPEARFFTGGGIHAFSNFNKRDNGSIMPVKEALRNSVNLVFIRLMKDIVNYYIYQIPSAQELLIDTGGNYQRKEYLKRFAEYEGQIYVNRFYRQLKGVAPEKIVDTLISFIRPTATRIAVIYTSVKKEPREEELLQLLRRYQLPDTAENTVKRLLEKYKPGLYSLSDRGYLVHIHPLKLWAAQYLYENPEAGRQEMKSASIARLEDVYRWLFKTRKTAIQDQRIRMILEIEAFFEMHRAWQRLGYPFDELVPSYATALGASADRPAALAELVGIIQNNGIRLPMLRVKRLMFAEGTPFETIICPEPEEGQRVLSFEVAKAVRACLFDVVENGTAVRAKGCFLSKKGEIIPVGGKTGTGDHKYKVFDQKGRLINERAMSRTAVFVFIIGDRFFGTISVMVKGDIAKEYEFTSSFPVQLFKKISPMINFVTEKSIHSPDQIKTILIDTTDIQDTIPCSFLSDSSRINKNN